jgi:tRNA (mo5U34)-methyltransferase
MSVQTNDNLAVQECLDGELPEALRLIEQSLAVEETADRWNSWASIQARSGNKRAGELGYRRALELDPEVGQAAANLGAIFASDLQFERATQMLQRAIEARNIDGAERLAATQLLARCRLDSLRDQVSKIKWWHSIDLGNGIVTPGACDTTAVLERIALPRDLRGFSVLDIGAFDGYFSFEAERRGASRVLATDSYVWLNRILSAKDGFELARKALGSRVEDRNVDVMDVSPENVGRFDVVLFLGVLYHLRHPLLALERVRSVTRQLLILETHIDLTNIQRPAMAFYPGVDLNNDPSNWWGPNEACCVEMLKTAGFRNVRAFGKVAAPAGSSSDQLHSGRITFHAEV